MSRARRGLLWHLFTLALVLGAAAAFYVPALRRTGGVWPAPLDDVYIHYDFARSAAQGRPFEWVAGNGYSSGCTSLTYPLVLAPGYLIGLRGPELGAFAALVACAALVDLCRSMRALLAASRAPWWAAWAAPPLVLSVPLLDWSWFAGMETALLGAVLGRASLAADQAFRASPAGRARAQLAFGGWGAMLFATRPETIVLVLPLGVAVAYGAGALGTLSSLARAIGPASVFGAAHALANRVLTSEWSAAGAIRKLLWSDPYLTPIEIAGEVIKNLIALRVQGLESALGGRPFSWILPLLGLVAALDRRTRRSALPLLVGALLALGLVAFNTTARFQNLRYLAPTLAMMILAAALGIGAIARRGAIGAITAACLLLIALIAPSSWFPRQIDHFARASGNIAEQQVEVGRRLRARAPAPRRVLVGDAGAIPYVSGLAALDGLGLGGYRDLPFARASVHGVPAVIELIERIDPADRPDVLALYPSWWPDVVDHFGRRVDAVRITDNVICAADEKVIYEADWSLLAAPEDHRAGVIAVLDVADLVSERAHAYEAPVPRGGWVIGAILAAPGGAARRFDAGRIVPEGREESFRIPADVAGGPATLALRTDGGGAQTLQIVVNRDNREVHASSIPVPPRPPHAWFEVRAPLPDVAAGDQIRVRAERGVWRSFHTWILRP